MVVSGNPASRAVAVAIIVAASAGCWNDADHLNPLDPLSPEFENAGTVELVVQDRSFNPLPGVAASLSPGGYSGVSGADGSITIPGIPPGTYTATLSGPELAGAVDTVSVELAQISRTTISMNAVPTLEDLSLTTLHVSRWWPQDDLYALDVVAVVDDDDGLADIASVALSIPHISFETVLQPTTAPGEFGIRLTEEDLAGAPLHSLLGRDIVVSAVDQPGTPSVESPAWLSRIIDEVPTTASPSGSQEVPGGMPLLTWNSSSIPFTHTYQVDVYRVDDDVDTIVYSENGLPSSQLTSQVTATLAMGQYYWTVSVVDEYGNRSRSKEAGFIVP